MSTANQERAVAEVFVRKQRALTTNKCERERPQDAGRLEEKVAQE